MRGSKRCKPPDFKIDRDFQIVRRSCQEEIKMFGFAYSVRKWVTRWTVTIGLVIIVAIVVGWYMKTYGVGFCIGRYNCLVDIRINGDGILTFAGIIIAYCLVRRQIYQGDKRARETEKELRFSQTVSHAQGAASNLLFCKSNEGFFHEKIGEVEYISAWRIDKLKNLHGSEVSYHINLLFRVFSEDEVYDEVISELRDPCIGDRWNYQIMLPLIDSRYGAMTGSSKSGGLDQMCDREFQHIKRAMKRIQSFDCESMKKYETDLLEDKMKEANDALLDDGIFKDRRSKYRG